MVPPLTPKALRGEAAERYALGGRRDYFICSSPRRECGGVKSLSPEGEAGESNSKNFEIFYGKA